MGFVSEELNETEKQLIKGGKAGNMAVVYGKEASIWKVSPWHLPARRGEPRLQDWVPMRHPQHWTQKRPHARIRKAVPNCPRQHQPGSG